MNIRTLEKMMWWGDKIGAISLAVFVVAIVMSGVFALLRLGDPNESEIWWNVARLFFQCAGISAGILILSLMAIVYAVTMLAKKKLQHAFGVNWKRDGF